MPSLRGASAHCQRLFVSALLRHPVVRQRMEIQPLGVVILALAGASAFLISSVSYAQVQAQPRSIVAPVIVPLLLSQDPGPSPEVTSIAPSNGATNVELDNSTVRFDPATGNHYDVISATFSKPLSVPSVNAATFKVSAAGTDLPATVILDDPNNKAKLGTAKTLALLTEYTATLTSGVVDRFGQPITETSWTFTTRDGTWLPTHGRVDAFSKDSGSHFPRIAANASGNAVAVWQQETAGGRSDIWASQYEPGQGWSNQELVEFDVEFSAVNPQVAIDSGGNATVVWEREDGAFTASIWANRHQPGNGWGTPVPLEVGEGDANSQQVGVDALGNVIAVWAQRNDVSDLGTTVIWSNVYSPGIGWTGPDPVESDVGNVVHNPQIAVNAAGVAFAVWEQEDDVEFVPHIWANRYAPGAGWGTPQLLEANDLEYAVTPQVAVDAAGNAIAVWVQEEADGFDFLTHIWTNRFSAGGSWGTAELLEPIEADFLDYADSPKVEVNADGTAFAIWRQDDENQGVSNIWVNHYVPGSGWSGRTLIVSGLDGDAFNPEIAVDHAGNAVAVWESGSDTFRAIRARRFVVTGGWGATTPIGELTSVGPQISVDGIGNMVVLWGHRPDGQNDQVFYNRFGGGGEPNGKLISETSFSDPLLGQCIRDAAAANSWHFVQEVVSVDCVGLGIRSLGGLQTFVNLEFLGVSQNQIDDVSVIKKLQRLRIVDIQGNPDLRNIQAMIDHPALDLVLLAGAGEGGTIDCADLDALSASNNGVTLIRPTSCRQHLIDVVVGDPALQDCIQRSRSRQQLTYVDELTELNCERGSGFNLVIQDLEGVQILENLESINIDRSVVQDLSPLAGLARLKRIDASSTEITTLAPVAGSPTLEVLTLKSVRGLYNDSPLFGSGDPTGISILSTLPSLREAYLGNKDYCPGQAQCVTGAGRMDCQTLDALEGTLEVFARPQSCNMPLDQVLLEIEDLALRQCISDTAATAVPALVDTDGFTILSCTFAGITSLKGLERFGRIKDLFLDGNPVQDLRPLNSIRTLERLSLSDTSISSFDALSDLALLRVLDARRTPLAEIDELFRMARLGRSTGGGSDLSLGSVDLTDAGQFNGVGTLPCADLDRLQALVEANNILPTTNFQPQARTPDVCSDGVPVSPLDGRSADINGDGRDDLVLQIDAAETASVTANWDTLLSGINQFVVGGNVPGFSKANFARARAVALGDANGNPGSGDDFDDLLIQLDSAIDNSIEWRALLSDGAGGFPVSTTAAFMPDGKLDNAKAIGFNDVDGDGNADILIERQVAGVVQWYLSFGTGAGFSDPLLTPVGSFNLTNGRPRLAALSDVNGDDFADLVYVIDRGRVPPDAFFIRGQGSYCVRVVLWNPDGGQGFVGTTGQESEPNGGAPLCRPYNVPGYYYLDSASVADVTGNGRKELVLGFDVTGAAGAVRTLGHFGYAVQVSALNEGGTPFRSTWGDMQAWPVVNPGTATNVFGESASLSNITEYRTVAVADMNNDRRSDVLIEVVLRFASGPPATFWVVWLSETDANGLPRFVRYLDRTPDLALPIGGGYQAIGVLDYNLDVDRLPDLLFQRTNPVTGNFELLVSANDGSQFGNPNPWHQSPVRQRVIGVEEDGLTALANDTSELIAWVGVEGLYLTQREFSDFLAGKGLTLLKGNDLDGLRQGTEPLGPGECVSNYSTSSSTREPGRVDGEAEYAALMCNVNLGDRVALKAQMIYGGCDGTAGPGVSAECEAGLFETSLTMDLPSPIPDAELGAKGPNASACGGLSTKHVCGKVGAELASASGSVSLGGATGGAKLAIGVGAGADMSIEDGVISGEIDLKFIVGGSIEFSVDPEQVGMNLYKVGRTAWTYRETAGGFVVYTAGPAVFDAAAKLGGAVQDEAERKGKVVLTAAGQAVYFVGGSSAQESFVVFTEAAGKLIKDIFNLIETAAANAVADPVGSILGALGAVSDGVAWLWGLL